MFGSLLYVTNSRRDVMQAVGQVVIFQTTPNKTHVLEVKRILIYLKGTTYFGLQYPKANEMTMKTYTYADQVGSINEKISTRGATFYLGN